MKDKVSIGPMGQFKKKNSEMKDINLTKSIITLH